MARTSSAGIVLLAAMLGVTARSTPARAQGREDVATLEKNLADESAALSTSDCVAACRALASIRRAADKICALEPGDRCTAAHAKAEEATRRVRDACPDCAIASAPTPSPGKSPDEPAARRPAQKGGSPVAEPPHPSPASAPQAESQAHRGGCAGCTTSRAAPSDLAAAALGVLALATVLRRRKR